MHHLVHPPLFVRLFEGGDMFWRSFDLVSLLSDIRVAPFRLEGARFRVGGFLG